MRRRIAIIAGTGTITVLLVVGVLWWYFDWGHNHVEKLDYLHEKPLEAVIANLGEPDRQLEYTMAECPGGEFRVELYNTYSPGDVKAAQARIKELQWHCARYHIAIWMHQVKGKWVVLDSCRWQEGVIF